MNISIEKKLIYFAPVDEATSIWGVYCLPRMWRKPNGELVIRINGEQDCADKETATKANTLYFSSKNNGKSWEKTDLEQDISYITGISPPILSLESGEKIALQNIRDLKPIVGV